jgi:hypothetical protein
MGAGERTRERTDTSSARLSRVSNWLIAVVVAPLGIGTLLLFTEPGAGHDITCKAPLVRAPLNHLARCDRGVAVRVSSSDVEHAHHPIFVIDGRIGSPIEKWSSFVGDKRPWVELRWRTAIAARAVVLHHAGVKEAPALNLADFNVRVRQGGAWQAIAEVRGNNQSVTTHAVPGGGPVDRVRIEILRANATNERRAFLYEIEVQGG